jgi:hypothetical protein
VRQIKSKIRFGGTVAVSVLLNCLALDHSYIAGATLQEARVHWWKARCVSAEELLGCGDDTNIGITV